QIFVGGEYLSRGDFYIDPGVRAGLTYNPWESLGVELRVTRFFATLDGEARRGRDATGYVPDSHAPVWQAGVGPRLTPGFGRRRSGAAIWARRSCGWRRWRIANAGRRIRRWISGATFWRCCAASRWPGRRSARTAWRTRGIGCGGWCRSSASDWGVPRRRPRP